MKRLYTLLLHLFPSSYRQEYSDELQAVFDLSFDEALKNGRWAVLRLIFRELIGLPGALIYEHLRQRRKSRMVKRQNSRFDFPPGSISETLAALVPLLLLVLLSMLIFIADSLFGRFPERLATVLSYLSVGLFFILILLGLVKRLPHWSMPYLGLLLSFFSLSNFPQFMYVHYGRYFLNGRLWMWDELVSQMYIWAGLTFSVILLVITCAIFPFFLGFRRDWTLLSFLVYGAMPLVILITFDEYQADEPY
jgi:hypothetical protein